MLKKFLLYSVLFLGMGWGLSSCEDTINVDDNFRLEFSADTLRFDTLFTQMGSTTFKLKVYNPSSQRAYIQSIALADGQYYALNIDGLSENQAQDLYLSAHDSMVIFVQAELPSNDETRPFVVWDSILFDLNQHRQRVILEAYGRNAIWLNNEILTESTTFTADKPYLISDTLYVPAKKTLTLQPGTRMYFRKHAMLLVDGQLVSNGTLEQPVLLRGDRDDFMNTIPPLNYDLCSGQWGGVQFRNTSKHNLFRYTDVRNADFGVRIQNDSPDEEGLRIENCQIRNMLYNLLTVINSRVTVYNSLLYNAGDYVVALHGGHTEWLQCTLANYYQFSWGGRTQPILLFSNHYEEEPGGDSTYVSLHFQMQNSIVYGSYASEFSESILTSSHTNSVFFQNCLLKYNTSSVITNPPFEACVFKKEPLFVFQSWPEEEALPHVYDFHIQEGSGAEGIANPKFLPPHPIDLDGNPRLQDGKCDAGCYEIVR